MKVIIVPSYILVSDAANCDRLNCKQGGLQTRSLCLFRKGDPDHPIDKELAKDKGSYFLVAVRTQRAWYS